MNTFRTLVEIPESENKISYKTKSMFVGSCFSENIGKKLEEFKIPTDINPFGVIYNPVSVKKILKIIISAEKFSKNDIMFFNGQWFSFYHHSRFSNINANKCLKDINERIQSASIFLKDADFLFVSFGTAWVYEYKKTRQIVANCHKIPSREFNRYLLSAEEIIEEFKNLITELLLFNPKLKLIFTVSPIRHRKDGAVGNQVSKSTLILSIPKLKQLFDHICYFPSYEIMMDDLRDYRFYSEDLIHLNQVAINYIWERFKETYLDDESKKIIKEIEKLNNAKNHKPFNPASENYQKFLKQNLKKVELLLLKYPFLDFQKEKEFFSSKLIK